MQASFSPTQLSAAELAQDLMGLWKQLAQGGMAHVCGMLEELDLSLTQFKLLLALNDEELTVKELAERLGLSLPGASRAVDQLVGRDLLHRREDAEDRRMKRIRVTPTAKVALVRLEEARLAGLEAFATTLSPAHRRRLSSVVRSILDEQAQTS